MKYCEMILISTYAIKVRDTMLVNKETSMGGGRQGC